MSETEDGRLVIRDRIRRRMRLWRIGAFGLFVVACFVSFSVRNRPSGPHLVRMDVSGEIGSDVSRWTDALAEAEKDPSVKGLLLTINSPGGAVTGGEMLHDAIERFARKKPVAVSMGALGASAGYMIAVPAQRIFAQSSTLTGSVGVIMQAPDVSGLLGKIGVNFDVLVSGPMKGQPSVVKPLSPEGREMLQGVVLDMYDQFVDIVARGRHMPQDRVRALADGRPYTGRQALKLGLIDAIGSRQEALVWLRHETKLPGSAKPDDIGDDQKKYDFVRRLLLRPSGLLSSVFPSGFMSMTPYVDGVMAIWKS
ncbi:signal peptide peptidase SppA [Acetobacter sp. AN02]|uniref:signal peptide peptidase SppA n=1 Tax=Acetobacter sp. AN02 TaxID=2894186 RepID=UPI0024340CAC|nr:signal peptide peptidase SppA [Acetobacter sp. AN02]MDG6095714.1 signal peptide peptidase SppA [Acetobacter sp. AN02]